jgi:hypothetical protein
LGCGASFSNLLKIGFCGCGFGLVLDLVVALVLDLVVALVVVLGSGDETPLPEEIGGKSNFGIVIPFWGAENFAPLGSGTLPVGISMP